MGTKSMNKTENAKRPAMDISKLNLVCGNDVLAKEVKHEFPAARVLGDLQSFIPKLSDPVKIICFNFHIFQNHAGSGNYRETDIGRLRQIVDSMNQWFYTSIEAPSDNPNPVAPLLVDSRIRFKCNRVEFYKDDTLHVANSVGTLQAAAVARNPAVLDQINVYITNGIYLYNGQPAAGVGTPPSLNPGFDSYIILFGGGLPTADPLAGATDWGRTGTLSHEFGHVLDLNHTYYPGADCTLGPEFLSDVFGTNPSTCPHVCSWGVPASIQEPAVPNSVVTNNLMGGNKAGGWTSRLQAARMHRALTQKSVKRYVAKGCHDCVSCVAFMVRGTNHVSQGADIILSYAAIDLNESWGWSADQFVAPVSGIYHFDISFVKDAYFPGGEQHDVFVSITRNGTAIGRAWSGKDAGKRGTGSVSINAHLNVGDIVITKAQSDGGAKRHITEYNFAGHLICGCC